MARRPLDLDRIGEAAGLVGPLLFAAVFTVEGALRPGYDPSAQYVSELSLGPRGAVQVANFVVSGALLLLFARVLRRAFPSGISSRWGPALVAAFGAALSVSGPFVMDPASTPRDAWTTRGTLHQLFGAIAFSAAPLSCLVFWRRFRAEAGWARFGAATLAALVAIVVAVAALKGVASPPDPPNAVNAVAGLLQRAALYTYCAWLAALGWKVRGLARATPPT